VFVALQIDTERLAELRCGPRENKAPLRGTGFYDPQSIFEREPTDFVEIVTSSTV
jgi:hypothetical protein